MVWKIDDPAGAESKKIVWEVAPYLRGNGVDLGAGMFRVLPHVITVDNGHHEVFGHNIRPDVRVETCERMPMFASQSMDFVFSSHLLEHIQDYKAALAEWFRMVKQGGYLILYLPHKDFYPNVGVKGCNPDHKHDFLPADIISAMQDIPAGWDLVDLQERNNDREYSMLLIFKRIQGRTHEASYEISKPEKTALVCRFGAFGDLMQSSSVWAGLKKQGYHVTLMTSRPGSDIITEDPNIDSIMLLDKDQVPNADLGGFWAWQAKKYTKFVNLSEAVEGTFLAMPGRTQAMWPPAVRHKMMNGNYVEHQHLLAGIPHDPVIKFYSTKEEKAWAKLQRSRMGKFVILWSLAGSSVHKTWAGLDAIIAALMLNFKDVDVVLCGGPEATILEAGWEKEPRVHLTCGRWSIRQTLSFIAESDLVIGPETGVLNAASMESMPKILFLSHSTEENLSRDWVETVSLQSKGTKCQGRGSDEAPACHMMIYGWDKCTKDAETGTAQCQVDISKEEVYWHLDQYITRYFGEVKEAA